MSEHNDIIPGVIAAAIAAAGKKDNEAAWRGRINEAIPAIAAMMNPPAPGGKGSRQWQIASEVLNAQVFLATYVGHEVEDSSTRAVVKIDTGRPSKNYPDGIEPIRTHRTDNAQGRAMLKQLDQLTEGDEIVVWKALETAHTSDGDVKVRVLVHLEQRPKWGEQKPQRQAPPVEERVAASRGAREKQPPADSLAYAFNDLPTKIKLKVVEDLRAEGITFPEPQPDQQDRFLSIIDKHT